MPGRLRACQVRRIPRRYPTSSRHDTARGCKRQHYCKNVDAAEQVAKRHRPSMAPFRQISCIFDPLMGPPACAVGRSVVMFGGAVSPSRCRGPPELWALQFETLLIALTTPPGR